jgi:hypothetical protein
VIISFYPKQCFSGFVSTKLDNNEELKIMIATSPYIYQPILPIKLPLLDLSKTIIKDNITVNTKDLTISNRVINELSLNVYAKASVNEKEIDDIIECTNTAFKNSRLNKEQVIDDINNGVSVIALKQDDKIVSSLMATISPKITIHSPAHKPNDTVHLGAIASVKKGAGKELINKTEKLLASQGFKELILTVLGEEDAFMHKYYKKLSFKPTGHQYIISSNNGEKLRLTGYSKKIGQDTPSSFELHTGKHLFA